MFKFYTIKKDDTIENLIGEKSSIKLSSAFNLNDPFELKYNLDLDPLAEGHESEFYKNRPSSTKQDYLYWQQHALGHDGYTRYIEQQQRNDIAQAISLCSFTEGNTNNLMWSHYTNNHEGICIEYQSELFDFLKTLEGFLVFWKVNYSDEPPTVNSLEKFTSKIEKIMFNKQSEWKYEREHRIIFISSMDENFIPIDKKFIKAVYIGSRTNFETIEKIQKICKNTHIDIYYGITLGKTYQVNFKKHKDGTLYSRAFW